MKNLLLIVIPFILSLPKNALAQDDTRIYKSTFEEKVFNKIANSIDVDALEIMIALEYETGNEEKIHQQINNLYKGLDPEKLKTKNKKKQIKTIYSEIHNAKLKKYVLDADFNQLFTKGEYNCVSATALYVQIFNRFNIDYEIRETPTHVYLIADPKGEKILVESTLPTQGTFVFDYKTQKDYVNLLKANKLISEEEFENNSVEKLFDQHYDTNKIINDVQLAALLYYNKGVEKYNQANYEEAAYFLEASYLVYPSTNILFMTNYALINVLAECENTNQFDPISLAKFVNLNPKGSQFESLGLTHFQYVGNELMVLHPNISAYKNYYQQFKSAVDTVVNIKDYELNYRYRLAYVYQVNNQYPEALHELSIAYQLNPENIELKENITNLAKLHMLTDRNHKDNIDSLEKYMTKFDLLKRDPTFQQFYNYYNMRVIREYVSYGKFNEGMTRLASYETHLKNNPKTNYDESYLAAMYLDIANYHFNNRNLSKVKQSIQRGLEIAPNSIILLNRMQMINQMNSTIKTYEVEEQKSFEEEVTNYINNCWSYDGFTTKNGDQGEYDKTFKIMAYQNKDVNFVMNGKFEVGKYSIRTKPKLLYLTPNRDKNDYVVFKIIELNKNYMVLMPFKDEKLTGEKIYLAICKD